MNLIIAKMIVIFVLATTCFATFSSAYSLEPMTSGEVRKVDKATKRITLKHGDIRNLGMPAMINHVQVGDKVRFFAEDLKGVITVTRIESNK